VPVAVEAVYAYGELQPAGGLFLQMAIEKANSLDTDAVRAAFSTLDVETFWGPAAWNDKGQNIKGASGPIQIQNGRIVSIDPEHLREAAPLYPMPYWRCATRRVRMARAVLLPRPGGVGNASRRASASSGLN